MSGSGSSTRRVGRSRSRSDTPRCSGNPARIRTSVVGYAPADPTHVWKDDHGIRVRAYLYESEKASAVYRLASDGVLTGASAVFAVHPDDEEHLPDHSTMIRRIAEMKEAGLCLDPANEDAYLVSVKADREKAWDGPAAMRSCSSAADFRSICAGEHTSGEPDTAAHWALPHHDRPGAGPNPDGVRAARSRFSSTQDLKNAGAARAHLFETHSLPSDRAAELDPVVLDLVAKATEFAKAGRALSSKNERLLRTALSMIEDALSSIAALEEEVADETKADDSEPRAESPNAWVDEALASFEEVNAPA